MILPLQTFTSVVEAMSAGLQGRATQLVDLSVGSVLRALLESCASVALWMQWLIIQVLSVTRASTSNGADLDSWMADFLFNRLPGSASSGLVTLSRFTAGIPALIPLGTTVLTTDGSLSFSVVQDPSNPAWNDLSAGYIIAAELTSVTVPVQAAVAGAVGNVLSGTVGLLGTALPGVDSVSNSSSFGGGVDVESDAALRLRFQLYINSRSLATTDAIGAAITGLQLGARYCVLENVYLDGSPAPGNFCVIVDEGGGTASTNFLTAVSAAVDFVRPVGTTFSVTPATVMPITVQMSVMISASGVAATVVQMIQVAVSAWINGLSMGSRIATSKLEALAHDVESSVLSVPTTLVNGMRVDLEGSPGLVFEVLSVNVNVSVDS